ncbi:hypothetical protein ACIQI7_33395 [Kitasatospora sp. NPDC092039]|uniref:hypothetical protein n=1 Tax=Kitasatospora sp. NPDC092039 TaxID=3364086 RepID=UPI00380977AA
MELSFADAYTLWRGHPFPPYGSTRELGVLRADLGTAYEYVMVVHAYMRTGEFRPSGADVLAELDDAIARADALCAEYSGEDLEVAREMRSYAALLAVVYQGFLKAGESV